MTDQRFMKAYRSFLTAASLFTWFNLGQKVNCWEKNLIKIFTNYSIKIDRCQIYSPRSRRTFSFYSLFFCVDEVESRCCKMVGGGFTSRCTVCLSFEHCHLDAVVTVIFSFGFASNTRRLTHPPSLVKTQELPSPVGSPTRRRWWY
jgi:hypothetical protein